MEAGSALYDADGNEAVYEIFVDCWREGYWKNEWTLYNTELLSDRVADVQDLVKAKHPAHLELEALNVRSFIARAAGPGTGLACGCLWPPLPDGFRWHRRDYLRRASASSDE